MSLDIPASGKKVPKPLGNLRERKAIQTLLTHFLEDMPFTDHSDLCPALAVPRSYTSAFCPTAPPSQLAPRGIMNMEGVGKSDGR